MKRKYLSFAAAGSLIIQIPLLLSINCTGAATSDLLGYDPSTKQLIFKVKNGKNFPADIKFKSVIVDSFRLNLREQKYDSANAQFDIKVKLQENKTYEIKGLVYDENNSEKEWLFEKPLSYKVNQADLADDTSIPPNPKLPELDDINNIELLTVDLDQAQKITDKEKTVLEASGEKSPYLDLLVQPEEKNLKDFVPFKIKWKEKEYILKQGEDAKLADINQEAYNKITLVYQKDNQEINLDLYLTRSKHPKFFNLGKIKRFSTSAKNILNYLSNLAVTKSHRFATVSEWTKKINKQPGFFDLDFKNLSENADIGAFSHILSIKEGTINGAFNEARNTIEKENPQNNYGIESALKLIREEKKKVFDIYIEISPKLQNSYDYADPKLQEIKDELEEINAKISDIVSVPEKSKDTLLQDLETFIQPRVSALSAKYEEFKKAATKEKQ
ncbi:hypothetical protein DR094_00255 [Mycoplasma flocculare]|uniref:Lipoprotein n=1 Tax=Mesomycoplasma flocculare TaxID=2128 RepID=A0AAW9X9H5_MESFC|nr:hypothetical protein [Mesomycoplasma flocculare]MXR05779.1 hypothetical protein [Mesomycoplasma flocculare]MXR56444.1 hypothetical protein [Mesomycoplasma flocculare]